MIHLVSKENMKTITSLLFVIFSIIGIADSAYLTYQKFLGLTPDCSVIIGCEEVLTSNWAQIGPIPVSFLGLMFYLAVFILGILLVLEIDISKWFKNNNFFKLVSTSELFLLITTLGFGFTLYLIFLMFVVIQAWCQFCLISAASSTALFITSLIYFKKVEKRPPFILKQINFFILHFGYTQIVKRIFFLLDAELVHNSINYFGRMLGSFSIMRAITRAAFSFNHPTNKKVLNGITFPNPVGLAAGFDYNGNLTQIIPDVGMGWHTIGTVTFLPYEGNKKPRLGRFIESKSLLVNKGLKSLGAIAIAKKLNGIVFRIPTGVSVASTNKYFNSTHEQIVDILNTFLIFEKSQVKHSYYELNISCPNTFGGEPFTTPKRLRLLLTALEKLKLSKPVFVKMPIDQTKKETLELLNVIDGFTVAGVIFGNLTKDKNNPDVTKKDQEKWKNAKGNLSGKPTWNKSNELIKLTKKNFGNRFTIVGTGGIFNGSDALKKMEYGADLIQLITGMIFEGPQTIGEINLKIAQKNSK